MISVSIASSFFHEAGPMPCTLQVGAVRTDHEHGATLADPRRAWLLDRKAAESGFFLDATNEIEAACGLVLGAPAMPVVAS